jgi:hypothetical protein
VHFVSVGQSVCIPSSIEKICRSCFWNCSHLSEITFETGSKLVIIGGSAFSDCSSLHSICLPASGRRFPGSAVMGCRRISITFDVGNPFFRVSGNFVVDYGGSCLVRYFGDERAVAIGGDIEMIGARCFSCCGSVSSVTFASHCRISHIFLRPCS